METSIDNALYIARISAHEAGHCVVAGAAGARVRYAEVNLHESTGRTDYLVLPSDYTTRAAINVAGAIAEAKLLGKRNWRQYLDTRSDHDKMVKLAESAGVDVEQLIAVGYNRAKPIIDRRWNEIRQLAARLLDKGGKITFRPRDEKPAPKTGFARLCESSARISARLFEADVSGERRDTSGKWTSSGGGKTPSVEEGRRIQRETYTPLKHPEEGHIDMRRLAIHPSSAGLEMVDTYKEEHKATPVESEEHGRKMIKQRVAELLQQGWRHTDESRMKHPEIPDKTDDDFRLQNKPVHVKAKFDNSVSTSQRKLLDGMDALPGQKDLFNSAPLREAGDTDTGWITIGGHRGSDGKKHGGTPVKVSGGKITHGPPGLAGKTLRGLSKTKPHLELRRAIDKAHKEHGFEKSDIGDAIEFVHGERKRLHDEREQAKEHARKLTGLSAGDISRLSNAGHDYASGAKAGGLTGEKLRHFDQFAQEAAREHPELGLGDPDSGDDFSSRLWDVLGEGKREAPAKHHQDTVDEAVQLLHQNARYKPTANEVPF